MASGVEAQLAPRRAFGGQPAQRRRVDVVLLGEAVEGRAGDPADLAGEAVRGRERDAGAERIAPGRARRRDRGEARNGVGAVERGERAGWPGGGIR